jgi:GntR family transcriptional regulator/MocR family aminotransferase
MSARTDKTLWSGLFRISPDSGQTLQSQIRQAIVTAILDRQMPLNQPLPSCRTLASRLKVARGTVVLAYQQLVDQGFLDARERRGHFVNPDALTELPGETNLPRRERPATAPDWDNRMAIKPSRQANIVKPGDWISYPYPFVYGQFDPSLFPTAEWRECSRMALGVREIRNWAADMIDRDDPLLVEQIQARLLPRRGIFVRPEEIMVTLGAQNALYLLANLLIRQNTTVGMEEPGYPDARNIMATRTDRIVELPVDGLGLNPSSVTAECDYVFTTPSHHCPTNVSMPLERRETLIARATRDRFIIIEDDYDSQLLDKDSPLPALKSLDETGRVIYIGSLSKTIAPGLRLGYIVADPDLLEELRGLRRLMLRHPPANNQRAIALFLSLGHHDTLVRRLTSALSERHEILTDNLRSKLPQFIVSDTSSGSSIWLRGPDHIDTADLAERARERGVLIEPGHVFFGSQRRPRNYLRAGISSIAPQKIEPGIAQLAAAAEELRAGRLTAVG